jgi:hypothetical protein
MRILLLSHFSRATMPGASVQLSVRLVTPVIVVIAMMAETAEILL